MPVNRRLDLFFPKIDNFIGPQVAYQIEIFVCPDRCSNLTTKHFCELDSDMTYSTNASMN
jgi:hypothetical protein